MGGSKTTITCVVCGNTSFDPLVLMKINTLTQVIYASISEGAQILYHTEEDRSLRSAWLNVVDLRRKTRQ